VQAPTCIRRAGRRQGPQWQFAFSESPTTPRDYSHNGYLAHRGTCSLGIAIAGEPLGPGETRLSSARRKRAQDLAKRAGEENRPERTAGCPAKFFRFENAASQGLDAPDRRGLRSPYFHVSAAIAHIAGLAGPFPDARL
jgi:hypothetical protein